MDILNQFGVNPVLLAAQVVNFLILLFILKKFLYKPLLKVLEERKLKIEESLKNAEEIEKRLLEITTREEEVIAKAVKEGEKIIKQAGEQATSIIDESKVKAEGIINHAVEEAGKVSVSEKIRLEQEIKENLSGIVALALEKVTGKTLSGKDQKAIIEREVRNMS